MAKCPACGFTNEGATAYCRQCAYELFPPRGSVHQRSLWRAGSSAGQPRILDFEARAKPLWLRYWPALFALASLGLFLTVHFLAVNERSKMAWHGHQFHLPRLNNGRLDYLIGDQVDVSVAAIPRQQSETPFPGAQAAETGTLRLSRPQPGRLEAQAIDWILSWSTGGQTQNRRLEPSHSTLARASVHQLANGGFEAGAAGGARTSRMLIWIAPFWPERPLHKGDAWEQPVEWVSGTQGWILRWRGTIRWQLQRYESCKTSTCGQLSFQIEARPEIAERPSWAGRQSFITRSEGRGRGEARFDTANDQLFLSQATLDEAVWVALTDLRRLPGAADIGRWVDPAPGELALRVHESLQITRL